jgi:hypothetical protein
MQATGDASQETPMPIQDTTQKPIAITYRTYNRKYNFLKSEAQDTLPRDKAQSQRLHEPTFRKPMIDPMTGQDIKNADDHLQHVDGNLTLTFTTEANRKSYQKMPINHPNLRLPYPPSEDDDRGG